jgi:hypothetical protein
VASVTGAVFSLRITATAANLDQEKFGDLCEGLSRRDLMVRSAGSQHFPDGTVSHRYEFVHALYREVFYGRQAMGTRLKLHQHIGEQLEELFSECLGKVAAELFRVLRKSSFRIGFGWSVRLTQAAATRNSPATNIAKITPEFNQSSRSP